MVFLLSSQNVFNYLSERDICTQEDYASSLVEPRMRAILGQFSILGIDLQRVYLNANSEDIYKCLDISI